jgi:hypothetical protein
MSAAPRLSKSLTLVNTSDGGTFQGGSQVAGLHDGGYVVVWQDESGNYNPPFGDTIVGQRYDSAGNKVGGEVQLSQLPPLGLQLSPAVTVLSNGNIAVAYVDLRGSPPDRDIHVGIFDSALNFIRIDDIDVAANPKQTYNPSLTALAGGGYVVSYTVGVGDSPGSIDDTDIVARIVSATGAVGNQFDIDNQNDNRDFSQLATLSNGNFVVVYQDEFEGDASDIDVKYAIRKSDGTPVASSGVVPGAGGGGLEIDPEVAALRDGGFVVVWTDNANTSATEIRASILSNTGAAVVSDFRVDDALGGQIGGQYDASVVALADGGFLVSWEDQNHNLVVAQRFDAIGNKVGAQASLGTGYGVPDIALLSDGRMAFAQDHGDVTPGDVDVWTSIWTTAWPADPHVHDFNADGLSDILWRNVNNGATSLWEMSGGQLAAPPISLGSIGTDWQIANTGDFNGDDRSDILWHNVNSGATSIWEMNGGQLAAPPISLGSIGTNWQIADTGDFNGDGRSDILWRNVDTGGTSIWEMNGGQLAAPPIDLGSIGTDWQIAGTGDFNADGRSDILWHNVNSGATSLWEMNGGLLAPPISLGSISTDWQIADTGGDFNGDGRSDILWRNAATGGTSIWEMNGGQLLAPPISLGNIGTDWQIAGTGDFNADGRSDILWRNVDSGATSIWEMSGGVIIAAVSLGNVGTDWHIVA